MKFYIYTENEEIPIRRKIHDWYIIPDKNIINGNIVLKNVNFPQNATGKILGYLDGLLIVQICCHKYALILGKINKDYEKYKSLYYEYLYLKKIHAKLVV